MSGGGPTVVQGAQSGGEDVPGWAVRLEAKLDVALAQHGARLDEHTRDLSEIATRIDKIEDRPTVTPDAILDHESRLRAVERARTVSPAQLGGALLATLGTVAALSPLVERFYS